MWSYGSVDGDAFLKFQIFKDKAIQAGLSTGLKCFALSWPPAGN
jgi:hypothetical protein